MGGVNFLIPSEEQMVRSDNEPGGEDDQKGKHNGDRDGRHLVNTIACKSHGNGQKRTKTEGNLADHSQTEGASRAPRGNVA